MINPIAKASGRVEPDLVNFEASENWIKRKPSHLLGHKE